MVKKVLITGAAGNIGASIAKRFTLDGDVLLALMRTSGNFYLDPISIEGELRPIFTDYLTEKNIFKLNAI